MNPFKSIWTWVVGIISALLLALKIGNSRKNAAEAGLALSEDKQKHDSLETKRAEVKKDLERVLNEKGKLKTTKPPENMTAKEIEDYWAANLDSE